MLDFKKYGDSERALRFFEKFSEIPHGSGNTAAIADYLCDFARCRGLFFMKDKANNVIIRKPATPGYENRPAVIFQGHTDMVAEKKPTSDIDLEKDGIELYIDGDFLKAKDTTLGGDDGVAIAYALAVLDSSDIEHPEFEAVFTSDEETGLIGATALDTSILKSRLLINIDSDAEGIFTVGCAGGMRMDARLPIKREHFGKRAYELKLGGLKGGHSGVEIDKGRLNAMKELCEALKLIPNARIVSFEGGNKDNAIPRFSTCVFRTDTEITNIDELFKRFIEERKEIESDISLELTSLKESDTPLDECSNTRFTKALGEVPSGVIAMSRDIEGLVETSMNLGVLRSENNFMNISYSLRSSSESAKEALKLRTRRLWEEVGATVSERGEYPAWEYKKESHLRDTMCEVYREMYGKDATVITIHAGLECGIFSNKMPDADCISIGPDNFDIHTTEERLSLSSFARVWEFLKAVLKNI